MTAESQAEQTVYIDGFPFFPLTRSNLSPIPLGGRLAWSADRAVRRGARLGGAPRLDPSLPQPR